MLDDVDDDVGTDDVVLYDDDVMGFDERYLREPKLPAVAAEGDAPTYFELGVEWD